jgi:hypothetical protein
VQFTVAEFQRMLPQEAGAEVGSAITAAAKEDTQLWLTLPSVPKLTAGKLMPAVFALNCHASCSVVLIRRLQTIVALRLAFGPAPPRPFPAERSIVLVSGLHTAVDGYRAVKKVEGGRIAIAANEAPVNIPVPAGACIKSV